MILVATLLTLFLVPSVQAQARPKNSTIKLKSLMSQADFARMGLARLSPSELSALESWLGVYTSVVRDYARKEVTSNPMNTSSVPPRPRLLGRSSGPCDSGHWIESVSDDGEIVKLEDGSIWQVDPADQVDSALWLPITDIIVCGRELINSDDNEKVTATRIK